MTQFCVPSTSTISEPRTTATTTTGFAGFLDGTAFGTYGSSSGRRDCRCSYVSISQKTLFDHYLHAIRLGLTLAGLRAFKPCVFHISVAGSSAVPVPSTAGSATTVSAGFLKRAAL